MASVGLVREQTFEEAIRAPGRKIEPPYRPFTELQRDPKLMAFNFRQSLDEVREHELRAMRCAIHSCERAMAVMEDFARTEIPNGGVTEDDVWAVLHAENIKRGGEWIETRLLTSGQRTNPWFQ